MAAQTNVYTGSNGVLTLANEDTPEGNDAKVIIEFEEMQTVGRVTGVEVHVMTDLQEYHEVGRRHATSLHPGNIHISGRIERAHINGGLLFLLLGQGARSTAVAEPYVQPTFTMVLTMQDPAFPANKAALEIKGVKLQSWNFTMPEEDFVMENVTFRALTVRVVGGVSSGGGPTVAEAPAFPAATA